MRHRYSYLLTVLASASLFLTGCRTADVRSRPDAKSAAQEVPDEPRIEELARAHAHYAAGVIHELNSDASAANTEYRQAAGHDSADEALVLDVSRRLMQAKDLQGALDVVQKSAQRPEASGSIYARLGLIYGQLGRNEEAEAANKTAIDKAPQLLAPYQNIFVTKVQQRNEAAAWEVLQQAAAQNDPSPEFLIGLAELYTGFAVQFPTRREEARSQAVALLGRAADSEELNPALLLVLAENLNQAGDSARAARLYNQILKNSPKIPGLRERVHAKLSEIYLRTDDQEKAREQLLALVREDPTNPQAHYFLGALAMDAHKPLEAIEHFDRTLVLSPDFEQAYYDLANAQISAEKPGDALATLEKARQKFPQTFVREFLAGVAYSHQKAYKEALQRFTAAEVVARAAEPKRLNHYFYFQVGAAYERSGQFAEAEEAFNKCLQLQPDFTSALNYLGYMWAERGEKLDKAYELIQKAVDAEPKNSAYLDSLGWVLFKQGKHAKALEYIQQAIQHSEDPDATLFDHLGDIQAGVGDPKAARDSWRKSLEIEDNPAVRKKLESGANP